MTKTRFELRLARWQTLEDELEEKLALGIKKNEILADWLTELVTLRKTRNAPEPTEFEPDEDKHSAARNVLDAL